VKVTARTDYALRAALALAAVHPAVLKGEVLAAEQALPLRFLENILLEMRRAGVVGSRRGTDGGYWLARPPEEISVAEVARTVGGFLLEGRDEGSEPLPYTGAAVHLGEVWAAVGERVRSVVEVLTLADVLAGRILPPTGAAVP
jgi:Rrf2 family protein